MSAAATAYAASRDWDTALQPIFAMYRQLAAGREALEAA
jgi:hypothetical protein